MCFVHLELLKLWELEVVGGLCLVFSALYRKDFFSLELNLQKAGVYLIVSLKITVAVLCNNTAGLFKYCCVHCLIYLFFLLFNL